MKNIAITIFIIAIVAILALYLVSFQVRETQSALLVRLGKPKEQIKAPGLYFKWPTPVETVHKFDSRMRILETAITETTTKGAVPITVKTYIIWNIDSPLDFFNAVGTIDEAENKLRTHVKNSQNKIVGIHTFSEFVNSDPEKIKFQQIEQEMFLDLRDAVKAKYGIKVRELGIKQLKVSEDVTKDVFTRMEAERDRRTQITISQGKAQAKRIKTDALAKETILLAAAKGRAKAIRGRGDAEAAQYYKMLEAEPDLAMFLRNVEAVKKILEKRSTIVISAETEPFDLLRKLPVVKLKEQHPVTEIDKDKKDTPESADSGKN